MKPCVLYLLFMLAAAQKTPASIHNPFEITSHLESKVVKQCFQNFRILMEELFLARKTLQKCVRLEQDEENRNVTNANKTAVEIDQRSTMDGSSVKAAFCMLTTKEKDEDIGRIKAEPFVVQKKEANTFFYLFNGFMIFLFLLATAASFIDYYVTSKGTVKNLNSRAGWKMLLSFSIPRNTNDIFSIGKETDSIQCLDAIRAITFLWIACGHACMYTAFGADRPKMFQDFLADILLNAYSIVDSFFFISGLLVSYKFFKRVLTDNSYAYDKLQWMLYYVHRWLRLTPSYLLFIGLFVAWAPLMKGEQSAINSYRSAKKCENYWWLNALYINNFNTFEDMCYPISWFLCVDTQLYFIAPLFLIAIFYSLKTGLGAVFGGVAISIGTTTFLTAYYDLPWEIAVGWLLSIAIALTIIFSAHNYLRGISDWNVATRSLYASFSRIAWPVAIAWVIMACIFGWAGPVKTILEHPLWSPLGRLSYCAFLAHWFVLHYLLNGTDRPGHFVSLWNTVLTLGIPLIFLSYVMAYVWSCVVEIPFAKIEVIVVDLLMRKERCQQENRENKEVSPPGSPSREK